MKQLSTLLCVGAAALATHSAQAQDYRPFRFGLTYQLSASATPGDTTHLLRLTSRQVQGADSLFVFEKRTSRAYFRPAGSNCGQYVRRNDNLFGTSLLVRPGAEYVLTAANGRMLTLRPRAALGQPWAATSGGLTARVTARAPGTVLGQADTLATITFSTGAVVTLSKRYGWVSGPALGSYLNALLPQAALSLTALPELGLGDNRFGAFVVYDFQPGDVFLRRTVTSGQIAPCQLPTVQWTRDSIVSRTSAAGGTAIDYQILTRTLGRPCGATTPLLSAPTIQNLRITPATGRLDQPTGFWEQYPSTSTGGLVHLPAWRTADYNGRPVQRHLQYMQCATTADSTSLRDASNLDAGYYTWTAPGLGQTRVESVSFSTETTTLVAYRKGTETWGQLTTFAQLLPTQASRPAATTAAFPNPFGAELAVAFTLASPQPVAIRLHDALGRLVLEKAAMLLPVGTQQRTLLTADVPAGVYSLHLHFVQEGRTEVLKVLKVN